MLKKPIKKVLAIILSLAMVVTLTPAMSLLSFADADHPDVTDTVWYAQTTAAGGNSYVMFYTKNYKYTWEPETTTAVGQYTLTVSAPEYHGSIVISEPDDLNHPKFYKPGEYGTEGDATRVAFAPKITYKDLDKAFKDTFNIKELDTDHYVFAEEDDISTKLGGESGKLTAAVAVTYKEDKVYKGYGTQFDGTAKTALTEKTFGKDKLIEVRNARGDVLDQTKRTTGATPEPLPAPADDSINCDEVATLWLDYTVDLHSKTNYMYDYASEDDHSTVVAYCGDCYDDTGNRHIVAEWQIQAPKKRLVTANKIDGKLVLEDIIDETSSEVKTAGVQFDYPKVVFKGDNYLGEQPYVEADLKDPEKMYGTNGIYTIYDMNGDPIEPLEKYMKPTVVKGIATSDEAETAVADDKSLLIGWENEKSVGDEGYENQDHNSAVGKMVPNWFGRLGNYSVSLPIDSGIVDADHIAYKDTSEPPVIAAGGLPLELNYSLADFAIQVMTMDEKEISDCNVGDTVEVGIYVTSEFNSTVGAFDFVLDVPRGLSVVKGSFLLNPDLASESAIVYPNPLGTQLVYNVNAGNGITADALNPMLLATVKLKVVSSELDRSANEALKLNLAKADVVAINKDSLGVGTVSPLKLNYHDIKIVIAPGSKAELLVNGEEVKTSLVLYAKYGEPGLYYDEERTQPVNPSNFDIVPKDETVRIGDEDGWPFGDGDGAPLEEIPSLEELLENMNGEELEEIFGDDDDPILNILTTSQCAITFEYDSTVTYQSGEKTLYVDKGTPWQNISTSTGVVYMEGFPKYRVNTSVREKYGEGAWYYIKDGVYYPATSLTSIEEDYTVVAMAKPTEYAFDLYIDGQLTAPTYSGNNADVSLNTHSYYAYENSTASVSIKNGALTLEDFAVPTIANSTEPRKSHFNQAIVFDVVPIENYAVTQVTFAVKPLGASTYMPAQLINGKGEFGHTFEIPGVNVIGDVEVRVTTANAFSIAFYDRNPDDETMGTAKLLDTAWMHAGENTDNKNYTLYKYPELEASTSLFTVPEPKDLDGYVFKKSLDEQIIWTDGTMEYTTSQFNGAVQIRFKGNTVLWPKRAKLSAVKFVASEHGNILGDNGEYIFEGGKIARSRTLELEDASAITSAIIPRFEADPGYVFKEWQDKDGNPIEKYVTDEEGNEVKATDFASRFGAIEGLAVEEGLVFNAIFGVETYIIKNPGIDGVELVIYPKNEDGTKGEPLEPINEDGDYEVEHGTDLIIELVVDPEKVNVEDLDDLETYIGAVEGKGFTGPVKNEEGDDVYTTDVEGEDILDDITINVTSDQLYTVKVVLKAEKEEWANINKKYMGTPEGTEVAIKLPEGYKIGPSDFELWLADNYEAHWDGGVQPSGTVVKGDATYTVEVLPAQYPVTWETTNSGDLKFEGDHYVYYGIDYEFTPDVKDKIIFGVTAKCNKEDVEVESVGGGTYRIKGTDIKGNMTITVNLAEGSWEVITWEDYGALEAGYLKKIIIHHAIPEEVSVVDEDGHVYVKPASVSLNGTAVPMFWSEEYKGYTLIVDDSIDVDKVASPSLEPFQYDDVDGDGDDLKDIINAAITVNWYTKDPVTLAIDNDLKGDINMDGVINIADTALINAALHQGTSALKLDYIVSDQQRLRMDVNGDKKVTQLDMSIIMSKILSR